MLQEPLVRRDLRLGYFLAQIVDFVQVARVQVHLRDHLVCVDVHFDAILGVQGQDAPLELLWLHRVGEKQSQTIQHEDVRLVIGLLNHLHVQFPAIFNPLLHVLEVSLWCLDCIGVDPDQLVENVLIDRFTSQFQLLERVVGCLRISELRTCLQHCCVSVSVGRDTLRVQHVPILDGFVRVPLCGSAGHDD